MQEQEQPQTKVLTTPELLEIILLHLDTRTLLVSAQRVCQTWAVLIQSSPAIQQALFFQPFTPKPKQGKWHAKSIWNSILPSPLKKDTKLDQGSIYNPLLVQAFRPFFPSVHEYPPIHDNEEKATETEHEGKEQEKENPFSFKPLDLLSSAQKKSAYMRKEASWRKMLLRQPPVYGGVTIFKMHHAMLGDSYKCYKVRLSIHPSPPTHLIIIEREKRKKGNTQLTAAGPENNPQYQPRRNPKNGPLIHNPNTKSRPILRRLRSNARLLVRLRPPLQAWPRRPGW